MLKLTTLARSALCVSILRTAVSGKDTGGQGEKSESRETHYD